MLIVNSGMSYHNMRGFQSGDPAVASASKRFDDWLAEAVSIADPGKRSAALADWEKAPGARDCHPRSDTWSPSSSRPGPRGAT